MKQPTQKHQQGFALMAGMLIVLSAISLGSMFLASEVGKQRVRNNVESFYNRVLYLKTQIHAYANDRYTQGSVSINSSSIFPWTLRDLEGDYVPECAPADNLAGRCMSIMQTPWGEIEHGDYQVVQVTPASGGSYFRAELTLDLPPDDDPIWATERRATLSMFSQLPNIIYNEASNQIVIRVDRPDKAFAYEGLVKRSGDDSTLLGDWDVGGNFSITNTRDVTIRNSDGSQTLVSRGLSNVFTVQHGAMVPKPKCPTGYAPDINLALGYVRIDGDFQLVGSQKPYLMTQSETTTQWQVGLELRVKNLITNEFDKRHTGDIIAITQCK